ncbi:MAG: hypothetical protein LBH29_06220 [Elusimicrobiota bacterium]|jgi:exopolysaccharide biosynthesis protein|nr:hypothetical protein [Elusimicrobiota bacterium]
MKIKVSQGQTLIEFLLVFIVLFAVSAGLFSLYKSSLKSRYNNTVYINASQASGGGIYVK